MRTAVAHLRHIATKTKNTTADSLQVECTTQRRLSRQRKQRDWRPNTNDCLFFVSFSECKVYICVRKIRNQRGGGKNTVTETYYLASMQRANILHEKLKNVETWGWIGK